MRKLTKALTVVSLLAPVSGYSLGIGDIRVRSALNQNLNAEIRLVDARGVDPRNIKVSLAPSEKFDAAGVPWTYFLSKIRFTPVIKPNGSVVIKVTSREALKEPYLNFLLEVSWPKGNLYREFTVLVDPPADYQHQTYQEPVYQEPEYTSRNEGYNPPQRQDYAPPRQRPVRQRAPKPRRAVAAGSYGGQIVTRRNDTLWQVAARARGAGVSVEQMMMALYEKNPHAFYQQNVNALSAGRRMQIPDKAAVQQLSREQALAEFSQHNTAWNTNRAGVPATPTQVARDDVVDSQLKLEAPTEATVGATETVAPSSEQTAGASKTAPTPAASASPDAQQLAGSSKSTAVDAVTQSKIAALEKQMANMEELIRLKDKQLADLQNPAQATPPATPTTPEQAQPPVPVVPPTPPVTEPAQPAQQATPPVTPVQPPAVTAPVTPAQPAVPPKPVVKPVIKKVEPSPVAEDSSSPMAWVLGGLGALLVPLIGWIFWQKRKMAQETEAESMFRNYSTMRGSDTSGPFSATRKAGASGESSFLNEFKASDFESFESFNVDHGDIDPIAEADVYLAYGRYQQAEDLIKQAINDYPNRDDCKLKLLEIYHANSSKVNFENYARELAAEGKKDEPVFWRKVAELGRDINPDSSLFSGLAASTAAVFSSEAETLTENVLFTPVAEPEQHVKETTEAENSGVATFEISDVDEGESVFDAPATQELTPQDQEKTLVTPKMGDKLEAKPESEALTALDEKFTELQDNEALDFDLGPYPGNNAKTDLGKSTNEDVDQAGNESASYTLDDSGKNDEIESFDFDFTLDDMASTKPGATAAQPADDTWDPDQTLEFSFDKPNEAEKPGLGNVDFNLDLELPDTAPNRSSGQDQGFKVSDLTDMDEMETKLDLAKAYIDMGDADAAKEILEQVLETGSGEQKATAKALMDDLT